MISVYIYIYYTYIYHNKKKQIYIYIYGQNVVPKVVSKRSKQQVQHKLNNHVQETDLKLN